ncbi:hypothetical protein L6452_20889 [Arctium lappa]|uniref:Uncharacterized protein n=1 Tax=Arctium lappa TaxID=4217 RepID=A0ACB9BD60_ARCLA|nr:hypothetical protein L6452_20889 [Arctium lappa]
MLDLKLKIVESHYTYSNTCDLVPLMRQTAMLTYRLLLSLECILGMYDTQIIPLYLLSVCVFSPPWGIRVKAHKDLSDVDPMCGYCSANYTFCPSVMHSESPQTFCDCTWPCNFLLCLQHDCAVRLTLYVQSARRADSSCILAQSCTSSTRDLCIYLELIVFKYCVHSHRNFD